MTDPLIIPARPPKYCDCCGRDLLRGKYDCPCPYVGKCPRCHLCTTHCTCANETALAHAEADRR